VVEPLCGAAACAVIFGAGKCVVVFGAFGAGAPCDVAGFGEPPPCCCAAIGAAVIRRDIARTRIFFIPLAIASGIPVRCGTITG
jgi:hypothetical protein